MIGRRVQTAGLTLLGHSRLLLRPKPAVSRGKMPGVNLASEKEKIDYSIRRASSQIDESLHRAYAGAERRLKTNNLTRLYL